LQFNIYQPQEKIFLPNRIVAAVVRVNRNAAGFRVWRQQAWGVDTPN